MSLLNEYAKQGVMAVQEFTVLSLRAIHANEQAAAIRERRLGSVELLDLFAARIEQVDPTVNAVCTLDLDAARTAARRADRHGDAKLTPLEIEAIAEVEKLAASEEFFLDMNFTEGDVQFLNNYYKNFNKHHQDLHFHYYNHSCSCMDHVCARWG